MGRKVTYRGGGIYLAGLHPSRSEIRMAALTRFKYWLPALIALTAAFALYAPGLGGGYYADDYQFVFDLSSGRSPWAFFHSNLGENGFYRPLQAVFLWKVQQGWGLETWPVHAAQVALHGGGALLLFA